ncbi:MAG: VIT1/CCC1 transporter family protein [Candidatus Thermoplasmatota archaeon]|nr:VIT1/CCC1 transporter family protein [Candidatus Thermoplasmatota archaeon]
MSLGRLRQRIRDTSEITDLASTSRRYFVLGAFDGTLIVLGVVLGAYAAGVASEHMEIILFAGLSAAVALSVSSAVGAYEAERVEKLLSRASIERALLTDVSEEQAEVFRFATLLSALVHAAAPLIAATVPLLPFIIIPDLGMAVLTSVVMTLSVLFILGAYLGNLVKERVFMTGMRFVLAGLATAVILFAIGATS